MCTRSFKLLSNPMMTVRAEDMHVNNEVEAQGFLEGENTSEDDNIDVNDDHEVELRQEEHSVIKGLTTNDILAMEFESVNEAEKWYMKYARFIGFGVRKNNLRHNSKKEMVGRSWLCSCEGHRISKHINRIDRKRMHKPITRSGYMA